MNDILEKCLVCNRSSDEIPLLALRYNQEWAWICPEHLPILIHKPAQLADRLPGAINLHPPAGHDHD